jgi:hypothetical protein
VGSVGLVKLEVKIMLKKIGIIGIMLSLIVGFGCASATLAGYGTLKIVNGTNKTQKIRIHRASDEYYSSTLGPHDSVVFSASDTMENHFGFEGNSYSVDIDIDSAGSGKYYGVYHLHFTPDCGGLGPAVYCDRATNDSQSISGSWDASLTSQTIPTFLSYYTIANGTLTYTGRN